MDSVQINIKTGNIASEKSNYYFRPTSEYNEDVKDRIMYIVDTWTFNEEEKRRFNEMKNNKLKT